jgi:hypothetical protein
VEDGSAPTAVAAALPADRRGGGTVPTPPGDVRADLEEVFRAAYPRVVRVAARVLGLRDGAEVYLGWVALWGLLVLGLAALAFQRRDV